MEQKPIIHKSVLIQEVLQYLIVKPHGVYIDATFGSGGHSRALLHAEPTAKVYAFDWDLLSVERYGYPMQEEFPGRFVIIWGNFGNLYKLIKKAAIEKVDGVLADFGTSQMQLAYGEGFSFAYDSDLDMRMSPSHFKATAAIVVNESSEKTLRDIFWELGEERFARQIAAAIIEERKKTPITTTRRLAELIARVKPTPKNRGIHSATQVFQALRMYVNKELENIDSFLPVATSLLQQGGRLVCISFHSLEDRKVKQFFNTQQQEGVLEVITKKIVTASAEELEINRSARSARLRAAQKL